VVTPVSTRSFRAPCGLKRVGAEKMNKTSPHIFEAKDLEEIGPGEGCTLCGYAMPCNERNIINRVT